MRMTRDVTEQAHELLTRGTTVPELCESWNLKRSTLYNALKRYGFTTPSSDVGPEDHVDLQILSGTPPEVYAARAGLSPESLKRYATLYGKKLTMSKLTQKREWWVKVLDGFSYQNARAFCNMNNLPMPLVAQWWHRIYKPNRLLLWGYAEVMEIGYENSKFMNREPMNSNVLYALCKDGLCTPIDIRTAKELYKVATLPRSK
ncbi:hypothetical protein VPH49_21830 [Pseudomonas luteola]|uniref:hypothetical protein n=1 Tax=Pseudomonas luteola TaxID=47886 RepID=UPI003A8BDB8F